MQPNQQVNLKSMDLTSLKALLSDLRDESDVINNNIGILRGEIRLRQEEATVKETEIVPETLDTENSTN